ncbi:MAG TPA: glutaredoxin 3 [Xanthobacteraceae bacterium]|nr:glutaredoxin 3 [Xanthobacteraceae bacterium]
MTSVEIYTTQYCPYCYWAKELLSRKGVSYREIDVTGNAQMRQEMLERTQGRTTLPQIFIGATHVGGCDELYAIEEAGKLDALLDQGKGQTA